MYFGVFDDSREPHNFNAIQIRLASPEAIRSWSHGEVTLPETINYRSFKPEKGGLFCERIFGPVKDWECNCGKYRRIRYRGMICENCGVEVTQSKVRRERLGHIELAVPVAHVWFFRGNPNIIGRMLDMKRRDLERVLYYESYVVLDPGTTDLKVKELLSGERMAEYRERYPDSGLRAEMGGKPIQELLQQVDIDKEYAELRAQARDQETTKQAKKRALKRLQVFDAFLGSGNEPEWLVMDVIPVLPPDLRPLVPLEGGRFATSDLNDLYRRVIYRNNRLKSLLKIKAPEIILRNEKRMLQQAVDALFDNGRGSRAVRGRGRRVLKSLSHLLKGKKGRFRQNLLGKRVDYSGRSVIVVGPELKLHQCGIPKTMALELFSPFIVRRLQELGHAQTVKAAKNMIDRQSPEVWDALEDVIRDHPIFLNRAPTLHRLGIQAFEPILVEGKAIRIHPLVCTAFNADFDGDQMAVHVPLSFEAQIESRVLMLSVNNILLPANGKPVASPSQDIVLGCYYLTKGQADKPEAKDMKNFVDADEVIFALDSGGVDLHEWIRVRVAGKSRETTPGRVLFNQIIPDDVGYVNQLMDGGKLKDLVGKCHRLLGQEKTATVLDKLKSTGFHYATLAGITIGIDDVLIPDAKKDILTEAQDEVNKIYSHYRSGVITDTERYNRVVDTWTHAAGDVADAMAKAMQESAGGFNPIHMMADSGARGSKDQIRQLAGMRGLMAKPQKKLTGQMGEIIESPIKSNFREGLTALEYFISTHGARKGLADTALKTADAGYLTRRLVDVAQEVVVSEHDCGTSRGLVTTALIEAGKVVEPLHERVLGRITAEDVIDPATGEVILKRNEMIDEEATERLSNMNIEEVTIRSVLTCESRHGVCAMCYGRNLANGRFVEIGEVVGIVAAQSIGEPGTQLTLRTFHIGGTAGRIAEVSKREAAMPGEIEFKFDRSSGVRTNVQGQQIVIARNARIVKHGDDGRERHYNVPYGATMHVSDGDRVEEGDALFEWDPYNDPIIARSGGTVKYDQIVDGRTVDRVADESTGHRERVVIEDPEKDLHPSLIVESKTGKNLGEYILPTGSQVLVEEGQEITPGTLLAKIQREFGKTRDITGGLPRVEELFEARPPKNPATISEIDGIVRFGEVKKGLREISVQGEGVERLYKLPHGTHLRVHDGEAVKAGDRLSEGPVNPHDILAIKGEKAVQGYLLNEIQEVYRLQGVKINDKHIEMIVRQMLQRVKVVDPGDTKFLEGQIVARSEFEAENRRIAEENRGRKKADKLEPGQHEALLLGITKAALTTDSFISAASFQETTRVLMMAATRGDTDELRGLKENVIIGRRIPAGTGLNRYEDIIITKPEEPEPRVVERPDEAPEGAVGTLTSASG
ncbi:MAG: DNA-directed RNA polymerase subunit beta' [Candidatus Eisenbacteria bacterium]|nr:DNA-directed RNA polymerase subunit beta' [Candidatus Eisenbacteria bacterium]